ncbi:MAG: aminopeptidase [Betaproteobacteria bacterium]
MTIRGRGRSPIVCAVAAFALSGCSAVEFYWQGFNGQIDLLSRAKPIAEVIETTPDPALKLHLVRAQSIRAFASHDLALPDNRSYTNYADLGRPFVLWNVFAAPELSLTPRQWCFPVAGCVAYRGYFAADDARAEAARIKAAGDDVHLGGVPAYSTLGYFDDPVLSTFVRYREAELARLIFHELAHQVVYVKDDTAFNESFAVAVEEEGVARWLAAEAMRRPAAQVAEIAADMERGQRSRAGFRAMIASARDRLSALYAGTASDTEKRAGKAAVFAEMRAENERRKAASDGTSTFDRWFAAGANNAGIAAAGLYADRVPQFKALLDQENGDLSRFYDRVKALAALPKAERDQALAGASRG